MTYICPECLVPVFQSDTTAKWIHEQPRITQRTIDTSFGTFMPTKPCFGRAIPVPSTCLIVKDEVRHL